MLDILVLGDEKLLYPLEREMTICFLNFGQYTRNMTRVVLRYMVSHKLALVPNATEDLRNRNPRFTLG